MKATDVGAGWHLLDWGSDWPPQLLHEKKDWWIEVDRDERLTVTDERRAWERGVVYAPMSAVESLLTAHREWIRAASERPEEDS